MMKRILMALIAFIVANALLGLAANMLIFGVGLSGTAAVVVSGFPVICALGAACWAWSKVAKSDAAAASQALQGDAPGAEKRTARLQLLLVLMVIAAVFGGCTSWPLPPALSKEQRKVLQASHIGGTAGVYRAPFANQSDEIMDVAIREVRATGLFDRVDRLESLSEPPTYRIEFRGMHWCSDTFPKPWLLLSLGVIPATEGACGGISLRLHRGGGERFVELSSRFEDKAIHGWVALFFNVFPDRTFGWELPEKSGNQRFIDRLAWVIAAKKSEIDRLP